MHNYIFTLTSNHRCGFSQQLTNLFLFVRGIHYLVGGDMRIWLQCALGVSRDCVSLGFGDSVGKEISHALPRWPSSWQRGKNQILWWIISSSISMCEADRLRDLDRSFNSTTFICASHWLTFTNQGSESLYLPFERPNFLCLQAPNLEIRRGSRLLWNGHFT